MPRRYGSGATLGRVKRPSFRGAATPKMPAEILCEGPFPPESRSSHVPVLRHSRTPENYEDGAQMGLV